MEISTIGIDLSKTTFHLILGLSHSVVRLFFARSSHASSSWKPYTATRTPMLIGMEAVCAGAHYLARALRDQRHDARLMPAQYVKPYVKTNKNDYLDAEAIAEAVRRPTMPISGADQKERRAAGSAGAAPRARSLGGGEKEQP